MWKQGRKKEEKRKGGERGRVTERGQLVSKMFVIRYSLTSPVVVDPF